MDERKAAASRWFDRPAGSYEGGFTSRWRDPILRASLEALELTADDRLLDVGCGTGAASRHAAATAERVVGVDLSQEMVMQAIAAGRDMLPLRFAMADSEDLPFDDGGFTAVLCSNSFHHYPNPLRAVREMARVLRPGGRLVIGDACSDLRSARIADRFLRRFEPGHVRLYRARALGTFLQEAGFAGVRMRRELGGGAAVVHGSVPG